MVSTILYIEGMVSGSYSINLCIACLAILRDTPTRFRLFLRRPQIEYFLADGCSRLSISPILVFDCDIT